ncbi:MAG: KEOPS complex subunit Pcc1 [Desulfurococcales archaeon]|jgi:hypothetical protein|nr:KEOPS complex subunit Pcc1 [Desulfurococcales archaeon]
MIVKIYAEVTTQGIDPSLIKNSLEPDNIDIPKDVILDLKYSGDRIIISIECSVSRILTCRSTMDEILMLIDSILKSLEKHRIDIERV